jgi:uncharacterized protein (TIGR03437 family)
MMQAEFEPMSARALGVLAFVVASPALWGGEDPRPGVPTYSASSIVNLATLQPGGLAPNSAVAIFGQNLSWVTHIRLEEDAPGGWLPVLLPGTGVTVSVNGLAATLEFVSPQQVNFLMPPNLTPGPATIWLVMNGRAGPAVTIDVVPVAPGLFTLTPGVALGLHPEAGWITSDSPALPGETIRLFATGLGQTLPPQVYRRLPTEPAEIEQRGEFRVLLDGNQIDPDRVTYVGAMPGFPGMYEICLTLPDELPPDPEVRLQLGEILSPEGVRLMTTGVPAPPDGMQPDSETPRSKE